MTDKRKKAREPKVLCRRIGLPMPLSEHLSCPYRFGTEDDVKSGDYERFCDFQAGADPICFGDPRR